MKLPLPMLRFAILSLAMTCALPAFPASEHEEGKKEEPKEAEVRFPVPPSTKNLLPFYVSATATQSFAVDAASISVEEGGIVRYTLVSTSPSGAKTVSYEGIRCSTKTWKAYAYGRDDGTWTRSKRDEWNSLIGGEMNRQQAALAEDFVCDTGLVAGNPKQLAAKLKQGPKFERY